MLTVEKRNKEIVSFDKKKIEQAIIKCINEVGKATKDKKTIATLISMQIETKHKDDLVPLPIETIQDEVEKLLMDFGLDEEAKAYILYRDNRRKIRELNSDIYERLQKQIGNILATKDIINSNANVDEGSFSGRNNKVMGEVLKQYALDNLMSETTKNNHLNGVIYQHDLDNYSNGMFNCLVVDFEDLYKNEHGFKTRNGDVREPSNIMSFMQLVAVVFQAQSQCQFGGIASAKIDYEGAPYVHKSFIKNFKDALIDILELDDHEVEECMKEYSDLKIGNEDILKDDKLKRCYDVALRHTIRDTKQACESLFHNLNTLESRPGSQVPFTSINFGLDTSEEGRLVSKSLLEASIDGIGHLHRTSIFPISIFKLKGGINRYPNDPNYDLFQLALKSMSIRIYPNIANLDCPIDNGSTKKDEAFCTMGCRTQTGFDINGLGDTMTGRGNIAPATINLVDLGIRHGICLGERKEADVEGFFKELDQRIDECVDSLLDRYEYIASQKARSAYFTYENGLVKNTLGRKLRPDEEVRECVKHGTLAIGFHGMAETCYAMFGKTHTHDEEVRKFAYKIVKRIREKADKNKEKYSLNFSCYATPAEGLCSTLRDKMVSKYGIIKGVTDREFLSNSYHIPVYDNISVAEKLKLESPFAQLCNGGNITYVELQSSVRNNLKALEDIVNYACNQGVRYLAINIPIDTCNQCGYSNEINDKCPVCGSDDIERLRRVTGYITKDYHNFNKGKIAETEARVKHSNYREDYGSKEND